MTSRIHPEVVRNAGAALDALDAIGIGVMVIADRDGELERWYMNRAAGTLIGVDAHEIDDVPVLAPLAAEERARVEALRQRKLAGEDIPTTFETVMQRRDGSRVPVEINDSHVPIPGGYLSVTFLRDITERQASQGALLEAERMAIVGAIAAGVAHEINNPLTYVLLHLRSLRRALPRWKLDEHQAADVDRLLAEAEGGAERVRVIVRDLLALARGQGSLEEGVDIAAVVDGAVRLLAPSMNHRARIVREGDRVPLVAADETRLAHAALAMLLFAAGGFDRDAPADNVITARVTSADHRVCLEVSDNGRDLEPEHEARAFEPFYAPRGGGAGASLAVARTVAAALGGSCELLRRAGGGTVTRLTVPAARYGR
jgi:two-component system, NtrC family, sensor kinase